MNPSCLPEDLPVKLLLRETNENLGNLYLNGELDSQDFSPDGRLDIKVKTRYGMQEAPSFSSTMPLRNDKSKGNKPRPPLAPLVVRDNADGIDVTKRTMGASIAEQEATTEELNAKIAHLEKTVELQRNVIISFCAYCQHQKSDGF